MKIFVGFGYNPRDAWIEDDVFRLIKAFDDEPAHGKITYGAALEAGVNDEIRNSDALIGFRTRREVSEVAEVWRTHPWVDDELLTATNLTKQIHVLEVRETHVEEPTGMLKQKLQGRQRILYDEARREKCLVEIAEAIGHWHRQSRAFGNFVLELLPDDFSKEIRPRLQDPDIRCLYRILKEKEVDAEPDVVTPIRRMKGRMAIRTGLIPRDAMIQVEVWEGRRTLLWSSDWQAVDSRIVHLER